MKKLVQKILVFQLYYLEGKGTVRKKNRSKKQGTSAEVPCFLHISRMNVELESNGKMVMLDESQCEYMMELLSNVKMSVVFTPKPFRKASGAQGAYCLTFYHKVDKIDSIYLDMEDPGNSHYYCSQNDRKYQIEYESAEKLITYFNEVLGN